MLSDWTFRNAVVQPLLATPIAMVLSYLLQPYGDLSKVACLICLTPMWPMVIREQLLPVYD